MVDAFKEWLKTNSTMPTPSDILKIAQDFQDTAIRKANRARSKSGLNGLPNEPTNRAADPIVRTPVAWHGMDYETVKKNGLLGAVSVHIAGMAKDRQRDYCLYLKRFFGFPMHHITGD